MVIVVNGRANEEKKVIEFIQNTYLPPRLTIILHLFGYANPKALSFPVNYLRNLAIRNVETTHYMILDMDLWPTRNAYDELTHLSPNVVKGKSAVILPAFFFNKRIVLPKCVSFKHCVYLYVMMDDE